MQDSRRDSRLSRSVGCILAIGIAVSRYRGFLSTLLHGQGGPRPAQSSPVSFRCSCPHWCVLHSWTLPKEWKKTSNLRCPPWKSFRGLSCHRDVSLSLIWPGPQVPHPALSSPDSLRRFCYHSCVSLSSFSQMRRP